MKAVMLMFDTLTRNHLAPYGGDAITPNFTRLAQESAQFDNFYVGSMPCMPARRELHTGRYNFLHRSWGPLEPFDFSAMQALRQHGVHTHMVTDHKHYWRDGGATYHTRYSTFEFIRGQEGDCWKGQVEKPVIRWQGNEDEETLRRRAGRMTQDLINRAAMPTQQEHFTHRTISAGMEFLQNNCEQDNWFLQIECFDPHEPFFVPEKYLTQYGCKPEEFDGWVPYYCGAPGGKDDEKVRKFYQALITMCDDYLGQVMDKLKALNLWDDTLFIVCTDHGFLLGEHQWWGKNIMPVYNEIANTPFFIRDPRCKIRGVRRQALAQTVDIPATLMEYFEIPRPATMTGQPLRSAIERDEPVRDYALFGYFGGHINITDGEYVYMRCPREQHKANLYEYTLMPTRIDSPFKIDELKDIRIHPGFDFTQGTQVMQIPATFGYLNPWRFGDKLFDLKNDPEQCHPLNDEALSHRYASAMIPLMQQHDAPPELYTRFELDPLSPERDADFACRQKQKCNGYECAHPGVAEALSFLIRNSAADAFTLRHDKPVEEADIYKLIDTLFHGDKHRAMVYQTRLLLRTA
ncbi:sulfatase [Salmonella enterica]|nr:sulfatase [Salmonella enterica]EAO5936143.1 sulfatase [Salmonella enterica subsp. houtenae serovar 48:g,z51:-]EAW3051684.1 sulfatase [Salmonella enterica subsp. enterica]ECP3265887.1 sulfatase [Salmonella enterica subsp. enterica serovar [1],13,23:g,z51:-]EDT2391157.1 sulfatase [Salmonella enterica subsp. arizonae]PVL56733.1 sulfatase [Salmonella enterica subsp. arizonae serovar 51:g,z51:-]